MEPTLIYNLAATFQKSIVRLGSSDFYKRESDTVYKELTLACDQILRCFGLLEIPSTDISLGHDQMGLGYVDRGDGHQARPRVEMPSTSQQHYTQSHKSSDTTMKDLNLETTTKVDLVIELGTLRTKIQDLEFGKVDINQGLVRITLMVTISLI